MFPFSKVDAQTQVKRWPTSAFCTRIMGFLLYRPKLVSDMISCRLHQPAGSQRSHEVSQRTSSWRDVYTSAERYQERTPVRTWISLTPLEKSLTRSPISSNPWLSSLVFSLKPERRRASAKAPSTPATPAQTYHLQKVL